MTQDTQRPAAATDALDEAAEAVTPSRPQGTWDRLSDDMQKRPRFYLIIVAVVAALAAGWAFWTQSAAESEREARVAFYTELQEGETAASQAEAGAARSSVENLLGLVQSQEDAGLRSLGLQRVARLAGRLADTQDDPNDRKALLGLALEAARGWQSSPMGTGLTLDPNNPEAKLPADQLVASLEKQLAFVNAHWTGDRSVSPTPSETNGVTLDLQPVDSDSSAAKVSLSVRVYENETPFAVHHLFKLVREGRLADTQVFRLRAKADTAPTAEGEEAEGIQIVGCYLGSATSRIAPDRVDLFGGEEDWVGFTLPMEPSRAQPKVGSVGFRVRREQNAVVGLHPSQLVILTAEDDVPPPQTVWVGELTEESLEQFTEAVLASLELPEDAEVEAGFDRFLKLPKAWKVVDARVDGSLTLDPPGLPVGEWVDPIITPR